MGLSFLKCLLFLLDHDSDLMKINQVMGVKSEGGGEQGEGHCCAQMRAGSFVQLAADS